MDLYVSTNDVYNSTFEEAQRLTRQRSLVQLNSFSIALIANNGSIIKDDDFGNVSGIGDSIANGVKMNFHIQYMDDIPNPESEAVPSVGSFINVGQHLKWVKDMQPNTAGAIDRMIANDNPGIPQHDINARISNMPGVSVAWNDAVTDAWNGQD